MFAPLLIHMAISYKQTNIHWNYFLAIESDFEKISRYVEFTEANNGTFSIELARIIMAATQEIDGIMKKLCSLLVRGSKPKNIKEYKSIIINNLPELVDEEVQLPRFGMKSQPWNSWSDPDPDKHPLWWTANNKIKHDRTQHFEQANLKNAFSAVGALLITTLYYYKLEFKQKNGGSDMDWQDLTSKLKPQSTLFILNDKYYHQPGEWSRAEW